MGFSVSNSQQKQLSSLDPMDSQDWGWRSSRAEQGVWAAAAARLSPDVGQHQLAFKHMGLLHGSHSAAALLCQTFLESLFCIFYFFLILNFLHFWRSLFLSQTQGPWRTIEDHAWCWLEKVISTYIFKERNVWQKSILNGITFFTDFLQFYFCTIP